MTPSANTPIDDNGVFSLDNHKGGRTVVYVHHHITVYVHHHIIILRSTEELGNEEPMDELSGHLSIDELTIANEYVVNWIASSD